MKAKRILSVLLAAMLTAGAMAGCSSNQSGGESSASQGGDSSVQESVAATEKTDVDLWYYWETVKHQEALDDLITKYNDGQESVTVTAKYVPFADFKKQLSIGASAAELPDLVIIDSPDHAAYALWGFLQILLANLTPATIIKARWIPVLLMESCMVYQQMLTA